MDRLKGADMRQHLLAACGVAIGLCALAGLMVPVHTVAQGPPAATTSTAGTGTVPKTPWGHPDLQGVWTTDLEIGVPLERPVELGEKALLTEAEYRQRAEMLKKKYSDDKSNRAGEVGNEQGPVHWYEGAQHVSYRTSLVIDPPNGRIPPYTADAQKRVVRKGTELGFVGGSFGKGPYDGPEDLALTDRCVTRGLPQTWFPSEYNNGFQIVQSADHVTIFYERLHEARVIPLDGRPHLTGQVRQWIGDSRGRWEGNTLVVDVANFGEQTSFRKSSTTLHLIERYTRVDPETVRVEVTVDDPSTWTRPWTLAVTGKKDPAYWQIFEYACHEGNYGMRNMLSGARAEEKAAREASTTKKK
jgi:hypothetical protein